MNELARKSEPSLDATGSFHGARTPDETPGMHDESTLGRARAEEDSADAAQISPSITGKADPIRERIGRFQIQRLLGEGSFGRVYAAPRLAT